MLEMLTYEVSGSIQSQETQTLSHFKVMRYNINGTILKTADLEHEYKPAAECADVSSM